MQREGFVGHIRAKDNIYYKYSKKMPNFHSAWKRLSCKALEKPANCWFIVTTGISKIKRRRKKFIGGAAIKLHAMHTYRQPFLTSIATIRASK